MSLSHSAASVDALQVQETTLGWLVGVTAATALHLGPALLPLQGQIKRVLTALFAAPSKVWPLCYHTVCCKQCMRIAAEALRQCQQLDPSSPATIKLSFQPGFTDWFSWLCVACTSSRVLHDCTQASP